jgi:hypothetical protein
VGIESAHRRPLVVESVSKPYLTLT